MQKPLPERIANKIAEKEESIKQLKSEVKQYKQKIKYISKSRKDIKKKLKLFVKKTLRKLQDKKLEHSISKMIDEEFERERSKLKQMSGPTF